MTKPIGYYVSDHMDADTLAEITRNYGDRLEGLDREQKIHLLYEIAEMLSNSNSDNPIPEWLTNKLEMLSDDAILGLMAATVAQLRYGE